MESIPVVDVGSLFVNPSEDDWKSISIEVDRILSSIGFVYLKNHGVPQEIIDEAFAKSLHFYSLPNETKQKYQKELARMFGYNEPNREILEERGKYSAELRESFDISLNICRESEKSGDLVPDSLGFTSSLYALARACHPLIEHLLRIFARSLKLDDSEYFNNGSQFLRNHEVQTLTTIRSIFYPPIAEDVKPGSIRCAPHSDYGTITLLFQDEIGGLEVQRADGVWVPATPIPGAILVNTGDLLNFWSGGRYPATIHRVLVPEIETKKKIWRQSIAYFLNPDSDVMVSPVGSQATNVASTPISANEHVTQRVEKSFQY